METKTFKSWNGSRELTRDEYINEWLEQTIQLGALFDGSTLGDIGKYFDFRDAVTELAGKKWDQSK